jgi:hypothetical protein
MAEVRVITTALRNEANKWRGLSDEVAPIKSAVEGLTLGVTAFYIGDLNAVPHAEAYEQYRSYMAKLLGQAQVEFEQVGDALTKIADSYDESDEVSPMLDLNDIYTVRPEGRL